MVTAETMKEEILTVSNEDLAQKTDWLLDQELLHVFAAFWRGLLRRSGAYQKLNFLGVFKELCQINKIG